MWQQFLGELILWLHEKYIYICANMYTCVYIYMRLLQYMNLLRLFWYTQVAEMLRQSMAQCSLPGNPRIIFTLCQDEFGLVMAE